MVAGGVPGQGAVVAVTGGGAGRGRCSGPRPGPGGWQRRAGGGRGGTGGVLEVGGPGEGDLLAGVGHLQGRGDPPEVPGGAGAAQRAPEDGGTTMAWRRDYRNPPGSAGRGGRTWWRQSRGVSWLTRRPPGRSTGSTTASCSGFTTATRTARSTWTPACAGLRSGGCPGSSM